MATIVLTAVGGVLGGPVGAAIGAIAGRSVDGAIFGPRTKGPRLSDLSVQVSSYGEAIPRLFGTLRVAGTVIWSTDLIEDKDKEGGGKGRPKSTTYSYSVSFAVALSGRAIRSVGRIWADGKLLRGAAGDWKSELAAFRVHLGDGRAGPDPLIASVEGVEATPAYDDIAYAVFEGLQLGDFGNRIPSMTFEVEADAGAVSVGTIAQEISAGAIAGETAATVDGYAASGASMRGAVEELATAFSLSLVDGDNALALVDPTGEPAAIPAAQLGAGAGSRTPARAIDQSAAATVPDEVQVSYYDPARDWQTGLQRARLSGVPRRSEAIELAAAMGAGPAKACAQARLARLDAARSSATAQLGCGWLDLRPGGDVALPGAVPSRWRIAQLTLEKMVLSLKLRGVPLLAAVDTSASAGRVTGAEDRVAGATVLRILDLPALGDALLTAPRLLVAAAGTGGGWRSALLQASLDGGTSWQPLGRTAPPAVIGTVTHPPGAGGGELFDTDDSCEVQLLNDGMWLGSATDDLLVGGANLALIGDEIIQFGHADPLDGGAFRLSRLLRGRRGTEAAAAAHQPGEPFVLLDPVTLLAWDLPLSATGGAVQLMATGLGDPEPATASALVRARSIRPPSPVRLEAVRGPDGALAISWIRRSRAGWTWADGGDVPLGEEAESYQVTIAAAAGSAARATVPQPAFTYSAADQAANGASGPLTITVVQAGTFGLSDPATLVVQ